MRGLSERSNFLSKFEKFFNDFEREYFSKDRSLVENEPPISEGTAPATIEEFENIFLISVDMPGLKKDEIQVDTEKIEAHFEDGVLKIAIPKKDVAAPYEVKIRGSERSP